MMFLKDPLVADMKERLVSIQRLAEPTMSEREAWVVEWHTIELAKFIDMLSELIDHMRKEELG